MSIALTLGRVRPSNIRGWPRLLLLYGLIFPPSAVLTAVAFWPMWQNRPLLALGNAVQSLASLAAGILLLDEPAQQSSAIMAIGASALPTAGWLDNWHVGPLPLLSVPASLLGIVLASWAMFCYPNSPSEMRASRRFFVFVLYLAADRRKSVPDRLAAGVHQLHPSFQIGEGSMTLPEFPSRAYPESGSPGVYPGFSLFNANQSRYARFARIALVRGRAVRRRVAWSG